MRALKIVPGGERVHPSPAGGPALRVTVDRPGSVLRRFGRRLARLYRAVDWPYVRFTLAVAATVFVAVYVALGRGA